jgi:hypothetical protein
MLKLERQNQFTASLLLASYICKTGHETLF